MIFKPFLRAKWIEAIRKEFRKICKMRVWREVSRSEIPQVRRCLNLKWVFEIKRDRMFRARLIACGYLQIPGEHYSDIFIQLKHF